MGITLDSIKEKMIGKTFGKLTIQKYGGRSERGDNQWICKCECGNTVIGRTANVDKPNSACTQCKFTSSPKSTRLRSYLIGKKFGRLTVLEFDRVTPYQAIMWKCKCDCGEEVSVRSTHLTTGKTQSCGCLARDKAKENRTTHGLHDHPLYDIWHGMQQRCYNSKSQSYNRYGARGIRVCEEWLESFTNFYNWAMRKGYRPGLSIERIDNDDNYDPGNCKWATSEEQNQNTSRTKITPRLVELIRADDRSNVQIAEEYGVDASTVSRVRGGKTWKNIL